MSAQGFPWTIASFWKLSLVKKTKKLWKSGLFYLPATCATVKLFHNFIFLLMKPWLNFIKVWSMMNSRRFYAKISRKSKTNAFFGIFVSAQTAQICVCQRHRSMVHVQQKESQALKTAIFFAKNATTTSANKGLHICVSDAVFKRICRFANS